PGTLKRPLGLLTSKKPGSLCNSSSGCSQGGRIKSSSIGSLIASLGSWHKKKKGGHLTSFDKCCTQSLMFHPSESLYGRKAPDTAKTFLLANCTRHLRRRLWCAKQQESRAGFFRGQHLHRYRRRSDIYGDFCCGHGGNCE